MTIASSTRKAGPFTGDNASTVFAFSFKVFSASDLYVVKAVVATGAETVLTLTTDYTVSLNADQNNSPGGTVTLTSVLASGHTLTLTSSVGYLQPTDLTNQGGFYPKAITTALDRLTILSQQLKEKLDRAAVVPISSTLTVDELTAGLIALADDVANIDTVASNLTNINTVADDVANIDTVASNLTNINTVAGVSTDVTTAAANITGISNFADIYYGPSATEPATRKDGSALQEGDLYFDTATDLMRVWSTGLGWRNAQTPLPVTITTQTFSGTGSRTAFTLSSAPAFLTALEVAISGAVKVPTTDYTLSGTTLTFASAPTSGTNNIFCRWYSAYEGGVPNDGSVTAAKLAPGAVESITNSRIGTSGPASYRNKLGNCSFLVNQMGTSFTLQPGALLLATSDLWGVQNTTDKPIVVIIASDSWTSWEGRKINLIYFTAQAQPTSGSVLMFQRIEGCNTLAGKAACLSYLASTPAAGVPISASWSQNFGSGGSSPVNGSFSPANVPNAGVYRYSTIANIASTSGKTIAAGDYLQITLDIPIRSTNPIFIGLPQLEEGSSPTPIEFVEDWVDWARCRRRYFSFSGVTLVGSLDTASSTSRFLTVPFPVLMRAAPTVTTTGSFIWSIQATFGSFVQLFCAAVNTSSQAALTSLIADARL